MDLKDNVMELPIIADVTRKKTKHLSLLPRFDNHSPYLIREIARKQKAVEGAGKLSMTFSHRDKKGIIDSRLVLASPFEQAFYTIGNASYCDFNIPGTFSMFQSQIGVMIKKDKERHLLDFNSIGKQFDVKANLNHKTANSFVATNG
jgi:hypothetical protein